MTIKELRFQRISLVAYPAIMSRLWPKIFYYYYRVHLNYLKITKSSFIRPFCRIFTWFSNITSPNYLKQSRFQWMLPHRVHHPFLLNLFWSHASKFTLVSKLSSLPSLSSLSRRPQQLGAVSQRIWDTIITEFQELIGILARVVVEEDVGCNNLACLVMATLLFNFIESIFLISVATIAAKTGWNLGTHFLVISAPVHSLNPQQLKLLTL